MQALICPDCGKILDPADHGRLVCDGRVYCDGCRLYDRRLLEPRAFRELQEWGRRLCEAFGCETIALLKGDAGPPPGPFDFLQETKLLMAEADHRAKAITLYPPGLRLATLCHELAHLMTGQDHTAAWARTFAELVAWVKARLPEDRFSRGMYMSLLSSKQ
ncbi:MAG: hypothetical protein QME75_03650 [Deltaproteobacteria bacterium]|nr:hypothetical protein [Deltaproteobacteria bacterium]